MIKDVTKDTMYENALKTENLNKIIVEGTLTMDGGSSVLHITKINDMENIDLTIKKEDLTLKIKPLTPQSPTIGLKLTKKSDKEYNVELDMSDPNGAAVDANVAITYDMKK